MNGGFPDRMQLKSFGQEIHITDLEMSDGGQYECTGLNTESQQRATKAFDVRIECKLTGHVIIDWPLIISLQNVN